MAPAFRPSCMSQRLGPFFTLEGLTLRSCYGVGGGLFNDAARYAPPPALNNNCAGRVAGGLFNTKAP